MTTYLIHSFHSATEKYVCKPLINRDFPKTKEGDGKTRKFKILSFIVTRNPNQVQS